MEKQPAVISVGIEWRGVEGCLGLGGAFHTGRYLLGHIVTVMKGSYVPVWLIALVFHSVPLSGAPVCLVGTQGRGELPPRGYQRGMKPGSASRFGISTLKAGIEHESRPTDTDHAVR